MTIVESSIKIDKPVETVFEFMTDLENMKKMSEYVTGIEVDGPLKLGTKYKVTTTSFGKSNITTNEIVGFEKKTGCYPQRHLPRRLLLTWSTPPFSNKMAPARR